MNDSFASELRSMDVLVDADAFSGEGSWLKNYWKIWKAKSFKRKMYLKGKNKTSSKKKMDGDSFTTGPKQKRKLDKKKSKTPEMDLFQKGVMPK